MEGTMKIGENSKGRKTTRRTKQKGKRKIEYVGWASRVLIDFLQSIGKDTTKALSQYDVTNVVNEYVVESKLIHPDKKKRVICDEKLKKLFGGRKQSVLRNKIHDLVEHHLFENYVESEDDGYNSDAKEKAAPAVPAVPVVPKRRRTSKTVQQPKREAPDVLKNALADMCAENIKLVHLKRSLVQQLWKEPRTFESKVVGSFVRIKADRYDIYQRNSYLLELVTGLKKVASAGKDKPPMLRLASTYDDMNVSALSEENFTEEECEDLCRRIKEGDVKQPTVGELEQKVAMLHQDITRHWLAREIDYLKNCADHANEKGCRDKMMEYLDRKKLLSSIEEQTRLLNEIPKVLPQKVEPATVPDDPPAVGNENPYVSPKDPNADLGPCYNSSAAGTSTNVLSKQDKRERRKLVVYSSSDSEPSTPEGSPSETNQVRPEYNGDSKISKSPETECNGHVQYSVHPVQNGTKVITLSDDEDETEEDPGSALPIPSSRINRECFTWFYLDPERKVQGPFSLTTLKRWHNTGYFQPGFKIWSSGQTQRQAVLLTDMLRLAFRS